jgi:hypothetical protein
MSLLPKDKKLPPIGALWNSVSSTDPDFVKEANNGRFTFTCIDPQYQLAMATKVFGPYGHKWGLKDLDFSITADGMSLVLKCSFFYPLEDSSVVCFPIAADMKYRIGDDAYKKLMTSVRSKALSYLGFNGDVFLGKFDDEQYVKSQEVKYAGQEALSEALMKKLDGCKSVTEFDAIAKRILQMHSDGLIGDQAAEILNKTLQNRMKK